MTQSLNDTLTLLEILIIIIIIVIIVPHMKLLRLHHCGLSWRILFRMQTILHHGHHNTITLPDDKVPIVPLPDTTTFYLRSSFTLAWTVIAICQAEHTIHQCFFIIHVCGL